VLLFAGSSAGCVTKYKPHNHQGGYSDYRIATDVFSVSFRGNAATREEIVEKYLFRRASELTLEHEFRYFVVLSEQGRTRSSSVGYSGVKFPVVAPGMAVRIQCFRERPTDMEAVIDAVDFMRFNFPEELEKYPIAEEAAAAEESPTMQPVTPAPP
jgi:hypothetical protein